MEQKARCCPKCSSNDYIFKGRKKIAPTDTQPEAIETRYQCRPCGHGWKDRVVVGQGHSGSQILDPTSKAAA